MRRRRQAGFTLLEMMIALSIFGLAGVSVHQVVRAFARSHDSSMVRMDLDVEGARAMDRIVEALRAADAGDLASVPAAPLWASTVTFRRNLGFEGAESTWSPVERVELTGGEVTWVEAPGDPAERELYSCENVAALLEGELTNLADDNGNQLFDEAGFSMTYEDGLLWIGLTLTRQDGEGRQVERSWTTCVRARN